MPECKKCQKKFPQSIWVNGQYKHLAHRVNCLDCCPFNIRRQQTSNDPKFCKTCNKTFFKTKSNRSNHECKSCKGNKHRHKKKQFLVNYKGGCCQICGYNKCLQALTFHHINPLEKKFAISGKHCLSIETLKKEVDKCILLCNRCHSELHESLIVLPSVEVTQEIELLSPNVNVLSEKWIEYKQRNSSRISKKPSKELLQELIWTKPLTQIGKSFGVSDNAVKKWCNSYGIKRPKQGYWTKKVHDDYCI